MIAALEGEEDRLEEAVDLLTADEAARLQDACRGIGRECVYRQGKIAEEERETIDTGGPIRKPPVTKSPWRKD